MQLSFVQLSFVRICVRARVAIVIVDRHMLSVRKRCVHTRIRKYWRHLKYKWLLRYKQTSCTFSFFPSTSVYLLNEDQATNGGQTFLIALVNALIVVAIVVVMTIVLVLLFKYRCYKVS